MHPAQQFAADFCFALSQEFENSSAEFIEQYKKKAETCLGVAPVVGPSPKKPSASIGFVGSSVIPIDITNDPTVTLTNESPKLPLKKPPLSLGIPSPVQPIHQWIDKQEEETYQNYVERLRDRLVYLERRKVYIDNEQRAIVATLQNLFSTKEEYLAEEYIMQADNKDPFPPTQRLDDEEQPEVIDCLSSSSSTVSLEEEDIQMATQITFDTESVSVTNNNDDLAAFLQILATTKDSAPPADSKKKRKKSDIRNELIDKEWLEIFGYDDSYWNKLTPQQLKTWCTTFGIKASYRFALDELKAICALARSDFIR